MKKLIKRVIICGMAAFFFFFGSLIADRKTLNEGIVRLQVIASSDSDADQQVKLKVRDVVIQSLKEELSNLSDMEAAKVYLSENLPKLQRLAQETLSAMGIQEPVTVSFSREKISAAEGSIISLPSGMYDGLRITIGEGKGHNWWGVVFPSLSIPVAMDKGTSVMAMSGLSNTLGNTLERQDGYRLRFFLLDTLGSMENFFSRS